MSTKELSKENNKPAAASMKTFMSVFRPIRDWLHTRPKNTTPISNPILKSTSATCNIQRHHHLSSSASANNVNHGNNNRVHNHNNLNGIRMNNNNNNNHNNNSNSYGGDSSTGSSGDMLSTAAPTPIHHQHHSTPQPRFTPIMNGHASTTGVASMITNMDDLNGSTPGFGEAGAGSGGGAAADVSGMGSTLNVNQHFSRTAQSRMSLPIMQHNKMRRQAYSQLQRRGQQAPRSLGYIYLQHKGETKQASLPNELTTIDTMRALFVCAFPHLLTMEYMCQPHVKIYIYNPSCNIFYELCDIEDVRHESVLRIHHSDPLVPLALSPQMSSMVSMPGMPPPQLAHNPYSTLHRLPPRLPQQHHHHQPQQQQHQLHSLASHQANIGSAALLPQHHIMQAMATPQPQSQQQLTGPSVSQISQIPPPKPRRMVPASYSMYRVNPSQ